MLSPDLIDVPIEVFGGYCPAIPPADLPPGAASIAQDGIFPQGGWRTRGGLSPAFGTLVNNAAINGLKSYITPSLAQRLMVWDSLGNLYKENPQGTLNLLFTRPYKNLFYQSQSLFGREYQAFFNALGGFDIPRQYDDTNWDRVSQGGPGASPTYTDFLPAARTLAAPGGGIVANIVASPNGLISSDLYNPGHGADSYYLNVTFTTTAPHGFTAGQTVLLAGVTSANSNNYNTAWKIISITATTFKIRFVAYDQDTGGSGTATVSTTGSSSLVRAGNISTANTTAAHHFQTGWQVQIAGVTATAVGGGIAAISQQAGLVTCTSTTAHGLVVNGQVVIAGTTNYNGTFIVTSVLSSTQFTFQILTTTAGAEAAGTVSVPWNGIFTILATPSATTFTYIQIGPNLSSTSGGTTTILGSISAGQRQLSVAFITRQGAITMAAVPATIVSAGGQMGTVGGIPIGPSNVVGRILLFTPVITPPASTGSFYSVTSSTQAPNLSMVINDNTSTSLIVNFLDTVLISSFQANYLFTQLELGESAFVIGYNSRLAWLGERARQANFVNPGFEGGFGTDASARQFPLGWTEDPTSYAGGGQASVKGLPIDWGDAFVITGDGATAVRGKITQPAATDYLSVPIISPNTSYSVRVRIAATAGLASGTLHINLQSTSQNFTTLGLTVASGQLKTTYQEFSAVLTTPLVTIPSDLTLQVYADGTPTANQSFIVDAIQPYPTNTPFNYSTARVSHAFNPESYDATTGQIQIRPSDGQRLQAGFPLRNNLYLAKDHYLGYVTDDGVNEPASWSFNEVSATIGICGPNAVDWTEEWAVFAERAGLHICWGSDPVKITQEIQVDASGTGKICWQSINWSAASTIVVRIDRVNKMILVAAPVNGATTPNIVFMLDYRWLEGPQDIANGSMVTYSAFTGKMLAHGRGRRWAIWNIAANSMCFAERIDGTAQPFFGNGVENGKIYQQFDCSVQPTDDGVKINDQYQTYAVPSHLEEQGLQLGSHRKLFGYLKFRIIGSGNTNLALVTSQRTTTLRAYAASTSPAGDGERPLNIHGERFFITISSGGTGTWRQLEKLVACVKKDAAIPVRGMS